MFFFEEENPGCHYSPLSCYSVEDSSHPSSVGTHSSTPLPPYMVDIEQPEASTTNEMDDSETPEYLEEDELQTYNLNI